MPVLSSPGSSCSARIPVCQPSRDVRSKATAPTGSDKSTQGFHEDDGAPGSGLLPSGCAANPGQDRGQPAVSTAVAEEGSTTNSNSMSVGFDDLYELRAVVSHLGKL